MKNGFVKIACATNDIKVANTVSNTESIISNIRIAAEKGVSVIVFPELSITGYTCGDLFLQSALLTAVEDSLFTIAEETKDLNILSIVGAPLINDFKLYNCGVAVFKGEILAVVAKNFMPNYSEFYELRHFTAPLCSQQEIVIRGKSYPFGNNILLTNSAMPNMTIGIELCEDLWVANPPSTNLAMEGASIIANLSAGDEIIGKADYRRKLVSNQSARLVCGYAYANAGSGESTTDMVFSGHSLICENGSILTEALPFEEKMIITELDVDKLMHERQRLSSYNIISGGRRVYFNMPMTDTELTRYISTTPFIPRGNSARDDRARDILQMQAYGLKKRMEHTHSKSVVIGISGGLDSTLALVVCAKAFDLMGYDRKNIHAITMPCFGTTKRTKSNAERICQLMNVSFEEINITDSVIGHLKDLQHPIDNHNVVYENAQARMRTLILMNLANKYSGFVIGTGDLSELALGWATYNGDHMSMYGVNASIPKTLIQHLIRYYCSVCDNEQLAHTMLDILDTPISPELLPADNKDNITQKTEDLVGPYILHDFFLYYVLRFGFEPEKIFRIAKYAFNGDFDDVTLIKWLRNFYRRFFAQQFKRSCLPDGAKVGSVSLSPRGDFRMPSDAEARVWQNQVDELERILGL